MTVEEKGVLPPGHTGLLGATLNKEKTGTNFAFYAGKDARRVDVCLFDKAQGEADETRMELKAKEEVRGDDGNLLGYIWHGFAKGVKEGAIYGFRVDGDYRPEENKYFNYNKLLVDPAAKAVTAEIHEWEPRNYPWNFEDNADIMPKARVVDHEKLYAVARSNNAKPLGELYPVGDTNLYEAHVVNFTHNHPAVPPEERGKLKALAHPAVKGWLKEEGFNSLELMPVEAFGTDPPLADKGLVNHWGYQTMAPMAVHPSYAVSKKPEEEFVVTTRDLKKDGIEIVMDIVPNHTLESGNGGPSVNMRGMDNSLYLPYDVTGTGNTRDFGHPINRRLLKEELGHWKKMGVSGFRIDLGTVLGRRLNEGFNPESPVMKMLREDHQLADVKIMAEPWDLGLGASQQEQVGRVAFLPENGAHYNRVIEWNPHARNVLQRVSRSPHEELPRSQIIEHWQGASGTYRDPQAFVVKTASHDGSTAADSVSGLKEKNNWAHREGNNDGNSIEGYDWGNDQDRLRALCFDVAMTRLAQGVPMMTSGNERGHSQEGDTNFYCMDKDPNSPHNQAAYIKWGDDVSPEGRVLMEFTKRCNTFRSAHHSLRRATFFSGEPDEKSGLTFQGAPMRDVSWLDQNAQSLTGQEGMNWPGGFAMMTSGDPGNSPPQERNSTRLLRRNHRDVPLLALVNPTMHEETFTLPHVPGVKWKPAFYSFEPTATYSEPVPGDQKIAIGRHSVMVFEGQRELAAGFVLHQRQPKYPKYTQMLEQQAADGVERVKQSER